MQRIRILYSKGEELLYTGNLDVHKIWERIFRRAELSLAYSQGFHPQPRIHQACPLPLGFIGENEILDVWLDSDETLDQIRKKLENAQQPGLTIKSLESIPLSVPALQTLVKAADYLVVIEDHKYSNDLETSIQCFFQKDECIRQRRGKQYDLLPLVEKLTIIPGDPAYLKMRLTTLPGATGRPEEVLDELGIPPYSVPITRTNLILNPND